MKTSERASLEQEYIEVGIKKWGEAERIGLEHQARAKSLAALQVESRIRFLRREGLSEDEAVTQAGNESLKKSGIVQYQALGCLDDGPT